MLQTVLFGLCGLRANAGNAVGKEGLAPEDFTVFPATLPSGWDTVHVGAVTLDGVQYSMTARHGERAVLVPLPTDLPAN